MILLKMMVPHAHLHITTGPYDTFQRDWAKLIGSEVLTNSCLDHRKRHNSKKNHQMVKMKKKCEYYYFLKNLSTKF